MSASGEGGQQSGEEPKASPTLEDAIQFMAAVKATLPAEDYTQFLKFVSSYTSQRCQYDEIRKKAYTFFKKNKYLLRGLYTFLSMGHQTEVPVKSAAPGSAEVLRFVYKIERYRDDSGESLKSFMCMLKKYEDQGKSFNQIYCEVAGLFLNHEELITEFVHILPNNLEPGASVSSSSDWNTLIQLMNSALKLTKEYPECVWTTQILIFCNKVKQALSNRKDYEKFVDHLQQYITMKLSSFELRYMVHDLLEDYPSLVQELKYHIRELRENRKIIRQGEIIGIVMKKPEEKDSKKCRRLLKTYGINHREVSINRRALSDYEGSAPSYRLVPKTHSRPEASKMGKLGKEVLNGALVSVASGSENFRGGQKNAPEERLFECEDRRFEMDLLIQVANSTMECIELLLKKFKDPREPLEAPVTLEKHFNDIYLRCIECVYKEHGILDVLDILRWHPEHNLPIVLNHLKEVQQRWLEKRDDYSEKRSETIKENHHKYCTKMQASRLKEMRAPASPVETEAMKTHHMSLDYRGNTDLPVRRQARREQALRVKTILMKNYQKRLNYPSSSKAPALRGKTEQTKTCHKSLNYQGPTQQEVKKQALKVPAPPLKSKKFLGKRVTAPSRTKNMGRPAIYSQSEAASGANKKSVKRVPVRDCLKCKSNSKAGKLQISYLLLGEDGLPKWGMKKKRSQCTYDSQQKQRLL